MSRIKPIILGVLCLVALSFSSLQSSAFEQSVWKLFVSKTRLFSVLIPNKPDEHITTFRVGDDLVVYKAEAFSFIDQRPYKDVIKNYVIKFEQTIGLGISTKNRIEIVNKELDLYIKSYNEKNATVLDREVLDNGFKTVGNVTLFYEDDEMGKQGLRLRITLTETTKFYQIFSGPEKDLHSRITDRYFASFKNKTGIAQRPGNINEDWRRVESPFGLFAIKIPDVAPPYFKAEPTITETEDREKIGMVFTDPIWQHNIYYNTTGYRFEEEMSFELAEEVILEQHLKRHGRNMVGIKLIKNFMGDTPFIQTTYTIKPPKGLPYVNHVRLRAMFLGNYMMVQEIVGPKHLVESPLIDNFFNLIEFTPKKAFQKEIQRHMQRALREKAEAEDQADTNANGE